MTDARQHYLSRYESLRERLEKLGSDRVRRLRRSAIERFGELGFPTIKNEEWKFTHLAPLLAVPFEPAAPDGVDLERFRSTVASFGGIRLVFVDGHFESNLSSLDGLPQGVLSSNLATAFVRSPALLEANLGQHALQKASAFTALNTALMEDGAVLQLPKGVVLKDPIHLVFLSSAPQRMSNPRILIVAGPGAQATVVEAYLGQCDEPYFTNAVSEVVLEQGAQLEHYRLQDEGARAFHVGLVQVSQGRDSQLVSHAFSLGGSLARTEVRTVLEEEGSACTLNGLYMGRVQQHLDNLTSIDHASSRCTSRELYKGVLDQRSSGVFSGRIRVHPDAQKTDASQTNKNLLLSQDALVDTKPQLEIFADDVKCTHGAAIGQLDEDAVFYLRARGIAREDARRLLTYAFVREMVDLIRLDGFKARIEGLVSSKLPSGPVLAEAA
jgi:Fe-S cluster assembly protein SufD